MERTTSPVEIELNGEKLGRPKPMSAIDAMTGEKTPILNGRINLSLPPMGWKLVWVK